MARFIVRYAGKGDFPTDACQRLEAAAGVRVVDRSARMLLVEGDDAAIKTAVRAALDASYVVTPEKQTPLPDTREKVRKPPK